MLQQSIVLRVPLVGVLTLPLSLPQESCASIKTVQNRELLHDLRGMFLDSIIYQYELWYTCAPSFLSDKTCSYIYSTCWMRVNTRLSGKVVIQAYAIQ